MGQLNSLVFTNAGISIINATQTGGTITFTSVKTGNGVYDGTEKLQEMTALKNVQGSFGIAGVTKTDEDTTRVRAVLNNNEVTTGYSITEFGLFAYDSNLTEVLFAIVTAVSGSEDYFPPYADSPTSITMEMYLNVADSPSGITFEAMPVEGTYATAKDLTDLSHAVLKQSSAIDGITNGTITVGNANKLDGHGSDYYAKTDELFQIPRSYDSLDFDNIIESGLYSGFGSPLDVGCANYPVNATGLLIVFYHNAVPCQIYIAYTCAMYFRARFSSLNWGEWKNAATTTDLANYLPLSGGTITGNLTLSHSDAVARYLFLQNSLRNVYQIVDENGVYWLYDGTNGKYIINSTKDGTSYFHGVADGNLPLSGGTVTGATDLSTTQIRNVSFGTNELTAGTSKLPAGEMYFQYE